MALRKIQLAVWQQLIEAEDPTLQDFQLGPSPGGAAAELGISRQAVHQAIRRGDLDVLAVYEGRRLSHYTISQSSIARYKQQRISRALEQLKKAM